MRAAGDIEFLAQRRFPAYTDEWNEVVVRITREMNDLDLEKDETIDKIAAELGRDLREIVDQPNNDSAIGWDASGRLSQEAREQLRGYLAGYRDFVDELHEMDNAEFANLLGQEKLRLQEDQDNAAARRDETAFFNLSSASADIKRWLMVPSWEPEEAVALSFGKEPAVVNSKQLRGPRLLRSPFRKDYARRLELVRRAIATGDLVEPIRPHDFIQWAHATQIPDSGELKSLLAQTSLERPPPSDSEEVLALRTELAEAKEKIARLIQGTDEINPKSRLTYFKFLVRMAVARFEYCPPRRSGTAKMLQGILEDIELNLDEDTIRDALADAAKELGFTWPEPIKMPPSVSRSLKPKSD